jgi:Protein of unknown function (DUF3176)
VALAALAAIVITLSVYSDRPIPNWPHSITINSLIAVYAAILKAAILLPVAESPSELFGR